MNVAMKLMQNFVAGIGSRFGVEFRFDRIPRVAKFDVECNDDDHWS